MTNATPLYVGPVRDRRKGKRILTAKNAMYVFGALLLSFTVISAASEFHRDTPGEFGRLYQERPHSSGVAAAPTSTVVVKEAAPVPEKTFADPMNLDTINREQVLGVQNPVNTTAAERDAWLRTQESAQAQTIAGGHGTLGFHDATPTLTPRRARFAISGGAGGVSVATATN